MKDEKGALAITLGIGALLLSNSLYAIESNQPYIDEIKKQLGEEQKSPSGEMDPYLQSIKKKLEADENHTGSFEGYTVELRAADPTLTPTKLDTQFIESEKLKVAPHEEGGAIQAVLDGKSELHPKKEGKIHHAFGVRYGLSLSRNVTAPSQVKNFNDVYGSNYSPDINLFYEFQPFHSEWYGNIGIMILGGLSYFHGAGTFKSQIPKPPPAPNGSYFPLTSNTEFKFFSLPAVLGVNYRFNLFRFLRPYFMLGATSVGYVEMRNDAVEGSRGHSEGYFLSSGVSILLDWFSKTGSWDLYSSFGIKHYYLTIDYTRISTFTGSLNYNVNGIVSGFTFEY